MNIYDACEVAYKNGYEDALEDILNHYNKHNMTIPQLVEYLLQLKKLKFDNWNVKKYFRMKKK